MSAAQQLLNHPLFANSKVKVQLKDYIEEQLLVVGMKRLHRARAYSKASQQYATLMAKAKSYYTNHHHCEKCVH